MSTKSQKYGDESGGKEVVKKSQKKREGVEEPEDKEVVAPVTDLITMDEFEAYLKKNDFVAIKFGMPGCKPCKVVAPAFERLPTKLPKVALATIDATRRGVREIVQQYDVEGVPVFHFFHKSKHQPDLTYQGVNPDKLWKRAHALAHLK